MVLSKGVADQLVDQLSGVLEQHINIMDISGIIIASTDKTRVGTVHDGARKIISEKLQDLVIERDDEFSGSRNGINLPILFDNEIVGVIGITGNSKEVSRYGQIIKRMTEILLRDTYVQEQKTIIQKSRDRFFEEWIFGRFDVKDGEGFARRAEMLDAHPERIRRVAVIGIGSSSAAAISDSKQTEISRHIRYLLKRIPDSEMFRTATQYVCLFPGVSSEKITDLLETVIGDIDRDYGCGMYVGVDSGEVYGHIKDAYDHAEKALVIGKSRRQAITVYNELDVSQFVCFIPAKAKREYLNSLFTKELMPELDYWIEFLRVFIACNGSIQEIAARLNMHKNTVQYKLNKLAGQTGRDPREFASIALYCQAIELYDYLKLEESV